MHALRQSSDCRRTGWKGALCEKRGLAAYFIGICLLLTPTTAAGMAISQGWAKLVGPAMLVGTLGYVLGTYAGTVVGIVLGL